VNVPQRDEQAALALATMAFEDGAHRRAQEGGRQMGEVLGEHAAGESCASAASGRANPFPPTRHPPLRTRFERCKQEILSLDWLSEGSVTENHPGTWRWTRKVQAKTVTVALSLPQAEAFLMAIDNHRRLEKLVKEMRTLSQTFLLHSIADPPGRNPTKNIPKRPNLSAIPT
jgi:hypothetical protein